MNTKMKLMLLAVAMAVVAGSASAALLVYEPFDYPDAALNGQGGALAPPAPGRQMTPVLQKVGGVTRRAN